MASLKSVFPSPALTYGERDEIEDKNKRNLASNQFMLTSLSSLSYRACKGFSPRIVKEFGILETNPEITLVQYPHEQGMTKEKTGANNLSAHLDSNGEVKYDVISKYSNSKDRVGYPKIQDLVSLEIIHEDDLTSRKPSGKDVETSEEIKLALEKLTNLKISTAMPVRGAEKIAPAQNLRYTPYHQRLLFNSRSKQRFIHGIDVQKDSIKSPCFKINSKITRRFSLPAPILHSSSRNVKEQQEWRVTPHISNWKNSKGCTISLHKSFCY